MRRSIIILSGIILATASVGAFQVQYDLNQEQGFFGVQVQVEYQDQIPTELVVASVHPDTEIDEPYGQVQGTSTRLSVAPWNQGVGLRADLDGALRDADGHLAVELGGVYFDQDCFQVRGSSLLFHRITNFQEIRILLPESYGLVFCNLAARTDYQDGRVLLTIQNPERKKVELRLVARLLWEEPLLEESR